MNPRLFFIILIAFSVGGLAALTLLYGSDPGARSGKVAIGGPFSLTNHEGKRVTEQDFRGKYMLVAFGYTYCPDICPSELQTITNAMDALGAQADAIVPVFVSVDPERDTVSHMSEYVKNFSPRIVGLTGTPEEIKAVAKVYRVIYGKGAATTPGGNDYPVSHSTYIYVMDPNGDYVTHFNYGISADEMAAKLKKILGG